MTVIPEVFGEHAARIASRIVGNAAIIACEVAFAASALWKALELRRAGVHFALSVHVEDVRVRLIHERSLEWCSTYATWDEVRLMFDAFTETIGTERTTLPNTDGEMLLETIRLADSVVVNSWQEHTRLAAALGGIPQEADVVVYPDPSVPDVAFAQQTDVVVYAPLQRADELAPFATALADLELPVTVVARDRPTIAGRIRFELPEHAARALGRARVIVDGSSNDPGVALALAKLGRPLAVSSLSGATELLSGTQSYDLWNRRSILTAVANALGSSAPKIDKRTHAARPLSVPQQPSFDAAAPLVSVIVPTYDRPVLLAATLATIERQSYPALEIIVVNDGGQDVGEVVARFPRARLITQPENRGPAAARNRGLVEARGTFVIFFDDDDEMFPDHISALVHALLRSGLDVAYGQMINCFAVPAGRDRYAMSSFAGHDALLDHADIQWAGSLATTAVMFRRDVVEAIGGVDDAVLCAEDYEFWLRLAQGREWVRVPGVTSMYFFRNDGSNRSSDQMPGYLEAHRLIYAKHPSLRPLVRAGRISMIELFS